MTSVKRAMDGESMEDLLTSKRARSFLEKPQVSTPGEDVFGDVNLVALIGSYVQAENLLAFSFVKKESSKLTLSYDVVIRAAFSNERLKEKMKPLVELVRKKAIFTPSPIRMLRLVQATKCERCMINSCASMCEDFGVAYCMQCMDGATREMYVSKKSFLHHPRVAKVLHPHNRMELFRESAMDSNGSMIGPIFTENEKNERFSKPLTHEIMVESLEQVLEPTSSDPFGIIERTVEFMFASKEEVDPYFEQSKYILEVFDRLKEEDDLRTMQLEEEARAKAQMLRETQRQLAEQRRQAREQQKEKITIARKTNIMAIIHKFRELVDGEPWSDILTHLFWKEDGKKTSPYLLCGFAHGECSYVLSNKSVATNKRIKQEVSSLRDSMSPMFEQSLHDFSFLLSAPHTELHEAVNSCIMPYLEKLQTAFLSKDESVRNSLCAQYSVKELLELFPDVYYKRCHSNPIFDDIAHSTVLRLCLQRRFYFFLAQQPRVNHPWRRRQESPIDQVNSMFPHLTRVAAQGKIMENFRSTLQIQHQVEFDKHKEQARRILGECWNKNEGLEVQDQYNEAKELFTKTLNPILRFLSSKIVKAWTGRHTQQWDACVQRIWRQDDSLLMEALETNQFNKALNIFRKMISNK